VARRPVLCLITDRHRLAADDDACAAVVAQVGAAARAGIDLVQIRERDLDGRALRDLTSQCVAAVRGTATRVLVNDRVDVALAAGAHGVHLRGDSFPAPRVRQLSPRGFLIGRSVHRADEARRVADEGGLDYLVFGPVYETVSKPGRAPLGLDVLREIAASTTVPVLAVGGVTRVRFAAVGRSGAAGIAAIGLFMASPEYLEAVVRDAVHAFDE
jgi:thiamine-phosphate pyrophosphorylase